MQSCINLFKVISQSSPSVYINADIFGTISLYFMFDNFGELFNPWHFCLTFHLSLPKVKRSKGVQCTLKVCGMKIDIKIGQYHHLIKILGSKEKISITQNLSPLDSELISDFCRSI